MGNEAAPWAGAADARAWEIHIKMENNRNKYM